MVSNILHIIAAVVTVAVGLASLLRPRSIKGFTGLTAEGGRGITEIRAILGGFFIGLGGAALVVADAKAYLMLGITYFVVALVRGVFMFVDDSVIRSNVISLVSEIVLGVMLVV